MNAYTVFLRFTKTFPTKAKRNAMSSSRNISMATSTPEVLAQTNRNLDLLESIQNEVARKLPGISVQVREVQARLETTIRNPLVTLSPLACSMRKNTTHRVKIATSPDGCVIVVPGRESKNNTVGLTPNEAIEVAKKINQARKLWQK